MQHDDDLARQDDRDAADDLTLADQDRAEHQAWLEGQAEDRELRDLWEPNPADVAPFPRLFTHRGRRGQ